jgi:hypothetical protein
VREIAETIGIKKKSVGYILHAEFRMKKLCARWVPHVVTAEQKRIRMKMSLKCLEYVYTRIFCSLLPTLQHRQCAYEHNVEKRSCDNCCSGKAMSITYSEFAFLALGIQHVRRKRHIVICPTVCFHITS